MSESQEKQSFEFPNTINKIKMYEFINSFIKSNPTKEEIEKKNSILLEIAKKVPLIFVSVENGCEECNGFGVKVSYDTYDVKSICPDCLGSGKLTVTCRICKDGIDKSGEKCKVCKGTGKYVYRRTKKHEGKICPRCNGFGTLIQTIRPLETAQIKMCEKCNGLGAYDHNKSTYESTENPQRIINSDEELNQFNFHKEMCSELEANCI